MKKRRFCRRPEAGGARNRLKKILFARGAWRGLTFDDRRRETGCTVIIMKKKHSVGTLPLDKGVKEREGNQA